MELDVFHLDSFPPRRPPRRLEHDLVVQAQPQLRHTAEVAFEFDRAEDFAAEDVSRRADEEVEALDDVQKDFVFPVPNPLAAPADGVGDGDGRAGLHLELVRFLRDVLLQDLGFRRLRVAEIHHLVEELVDDDEIVADGFLLQCLEVFSEDGDEAVEEKEERGRVGVALRQGEEVEVRVANIEVLFLQLVWEVWNVGVRQV